MTLSHKPKLLFLNRSYWPDTEATGQLLTELAESLVDEFDVSVACGQPNSTTERVRIERQGTSLHNGVTIHRLRHSQFAKRSLRGKLLNLSTFAASAYHWSKRVHDVNIVVSETDPFLLPFVGHRIAQRNAAIHICYLQDIYPDIAVSLGIKQEGFLTRRLREKLRRVYNASRSVVVLSEDMRTRMSEWPVEMERLKIIPNWVDCNHIRPVKQANPWRERNGLTGRFVVMYSGNLGLSQPLDQLIEAWAKLPGGSQKTLVFVGEGARKQKLIELSASHPQCDIRFFSYQPYQDLTNSLSAADLHIVAIDNRIRGCLMPSKLYGILASGTPVLAIADESVDTSQLILKHRVGLIASPNSVEQTQSQLEWAMSNPIDLHAMGHRARQLAVEQFDRPHCHGLFRQHLHEALAG